MKLINVDTFESGDFGIGLKPKRSKSINNQPSVAALAKIKNGKVSQRNEYGTGGIGSDTQ